MRERRQVPRYISELRGVIDQAGIVSSQKITITTFSVRGCCVANVGPLKNGQKCELTLEWNGKSLRLETDVVWRNMVGRAGLKFSTLSQETQNQLRALCASLTLQPLQPPESPSPKPEQ